LVGGLVYFLLARRSVSAETAAIPTASEAQLGAVATDS
jgi:hypothetical protein